MDSPLVDDPYGEIDGVTCGEPDDHDDLIVFPPVADLTGDEIRLSGAPVSELLTSRVGSELRFIARASSTAGDVHRGRLLAKASTMTARQGQSALRALGWRIRTTAEFTQVVRNFQGAWNLGPALKVDGVIGPVTSAALSVSLTRKAKGQPSVSVSFSFEELACKCGGKHADCQRIWSDRALLTSLEIIRKKAYRGGLALRSACRCPGHNSAVGGAKTSQHMWGSAVDLEAAVVKDAVMATWAVMAGIGRVGSTGMVRHGDRRDQSGYNPTKGSLTRPTLWTYAA